MIFSEDRQTFFGNHALAAFASVLGGQGMICGTCLAIFGKDHALPRNASRPRTRRRLRPRPAARWRRCAAGTAGYGAARVLRAAPEARAAPWARASAAP